MSSTSSEKYEQIARTYIMDQLVTFKYSKRCCLTLSSTFGASERAIIEQYVETFGYRIRPHVENGFQTIKVYKPSCLHYLLKPPMLALHENTKKDLFNLLRQVNFVGGKADIQMDPDFPAPPRVKPLLPPHKFALGLKQSMSHKNTEGQLNFQRQCRLQPFKQSIMEAIVRSRVVVVNGASRFDKSTGVPMFLLESCAENGGHCKIICVEREELFAINHSEFLAKHLGEKVGQTVAYQVRLQSRISESSNVIYTTASYLLRAFIGQPIIESFRHVSHIVIADVHMHDPYNDLLLHEIRSALRYQPLLKVVLLMHTRLFVPYLHYLESFGEVVELETGRSADEVRNSPSVYYMEDVRQMIADNNVKSPETGARNVAPNILRDYGSNREHLDRLLDHYERTPNEANFDAYMYMVLGEMTPLNYRHSVTGTTLMTLAGRLGKAEHVNRLLKIHADPFVDDNNHINGVSGALTCGDYRTIDLFNQYCCSGQTPIDFNPMNFDYDLIMDLISMLLTRSKWDSGNILVILPSYQHLLRMNFRVLRHKMAGHLAQNISVSLLHSDSDKEDLEEVIKSSRDCTKIIIATDIVESMSQLRDIAYVIDSGRVKYHIYNPMTRCSQYVFHWRSQMNFDSRTMLINSDQGIAGACFRLVPSKLFQALPYAQKPLVLRLPLDRICLLVKLLSPQKTISEYLGSLIAPPPFLHIHHAIEALRKIEVLTELDEVTWLGVRLLDVPLPCQLSKMLVYAVILRCIDPILTIVSFLSVSEPYELPPYVDGKSDLYITAIRQRIKEERQRLSGGTYSDHLIYLKLYQEWQHNFGNDGPDLTLQDENKFVLDGILERVWGMRTALLASLRAAQLIHNMGFLCMNHVNRNSSSWAIIKATLVAGSYPKLCALDVPPERIKSNAALELVLGPTSSLRQLPLLPLSLVAKQFPSQWMVYNRETNSGRYNSINCCTVVGPILLALFAGTSKIHPMSVVPTFDLDHTLTAPIDSNEMQASKAYFYVDEWIWFEMNMGEARLLLKTRMLFHHIFHRFLQHCGNVEKWRRGCGMLHELHLLLEMFNKMLRQQDEFCGFKYPEHVGLRPKAVPRKFITQFNKLLSWKPPAGDAPIDWWRHTQCQKQFFMVYFDERTDHSHNRYSTSWLRNVVEDAIVPKLAENKLTYIILYSRSPDQLFSIAIAKKDDNTANVIHCFKNKVQIYELINICTRNHIVIPQFNERKAIFQLDEKVGEIILDLFAFRNNWLHNIN